MRSPVLGGEAVPRRLGAGLTVTVLSAVLSVVLITAVTAEPSLTYAGMLIGLAGAATTAALLRGLSWASPYLVLTAGLTVLGLVGFFAYPALAEHGPAPKLFTFDFGSEGASRALLAYASTLVVPALFALGTTCRPLAATAERVGIRDVARLVPGRRTDVPPWVVAIAIGAPVMWLLGCDVPSLFLRATYQDFYGEYVTFYRVGNALNFGASLLAFYGLFGSATGMRRGLLWVAALLTIFLCVGTTSRQTALLPLFALAAWYVQRRPSRAKLVLVGSGCVALAAVLLQAMLTLREGAAFGWTVYAQRVLADPGYHLWPQLPALMANLLSGFPKTIFILDRETVSAGHVLAGLDPRPSWTVGAASELKVLPYIPYNAIGTLGEVSMLLLPLFSLIACSVFALCRWLTGRLQDSLYRTAITGLLFASAFLLVVFLTLYQLRSSMRLLTYLPFLCAAFVLVDRLRTPAHH